MVRFHRSEQWLFLRLVGPTFHSTKSDFGIFHNDAWLESGVIVLGDYPGSPKLRHRPALNLKARDPSYGQSWTRRPLCVLLIGHPGLEQLCLLLMPPDELKADRRTGGIKAGWQDNRWTAG